MQSCSRGHMRRITLPGWDLDPQVSVDGYSEQSEDRTLGQNQHCARHQQTAVEVRLESDTYSYRQWDDQRSYCNVSERQRNNEAKCSISQRFINFHCPNHHHVSYDGWHGDHHLHAHVEGFGRGKLLGHSSARRWISTWKWVFKWKWCVNWLTVVVQRKILPLKRCPQMSSGIPDIYILKWNARRTNPTNHRSDLQNLLLKISTSFGVFSSFTTTPLHWIHLRSCETCARHLFIPQSNKYISPCHLQLSVSSLNVQTIGK